MDQEFWHNKWQHNEIGFHNSDVHPLLIRYWPTLALPEAARVLVPMAGKSLDLCWLLEQGLAVTAVELSKLAAECFFTEQAWSAHISESGAYTVYQHGALEFRVGDFFALSPSNDAPFDALYDRAALIALPAAMRERYVTVLASVLRPGATGLLISLEYEDDRRDGPPFAIDGDAIVQLFDHAFSVHCHGRHESEVRGEPCFETVYTLQRRG